MAFTRDELADYEKKPQTTVSDKANPFKPAKPEAKKEADPAPSEDEVEVEVETDTDDSADPSTADESETDPDDQGDGTSDETDVNEDSSTSDDATESDSETDEPAEEEAPRPKKGSAAERIQELVDERDGYRAYGEYAQEKLTVYDKELTELRAKATAKPAAAAPVKDEPETPMPTMDDPDVVYDPEKFSKKMAAWVTDKVERTVAKKVAATPAPAGEDSTPKPVKEFIGRVDSFKETHKDFDALTKTLPQLSAEAARVVILSEKGPDILYYMGKHRADAVRIARLDPEEQLMEIGVIRARLKTTGDRKAVLPPKDQTVEQGASKAPAKPKSPSNAPPPPRPIQGGGRRDQRDIQDPGLGMDEFVRRHRAEKTQGREANRKARGLR